MTGSSWWKDATITTDVELLGEQGDAGVILRGSDEFVVAGLHALLSQRTSVSQSLLSDLEARGETNQFT